MIPFIEQLDTQKIWNDSLEHNFKQLLTNVYNGIDGVYRLSVLLNQFKF